MTSALVAQEPTLWRGDEMNGSYPDKGLLKSWPDNGPELLWHFDEAGKGFSTPVFSDGKIFLSGIRDSHNTDNLSVCIEIYLQERCTPFCVRPVIFTPFLFTVPYGCS